MPCTCISRAAHFGAELAEILVARRAGEVLRARAPRRRGRARKGCPHRPGRGRVRRRPGGAPPPAPRPPPRAGESGAVSPRTAARATRASCASYGRTPCGRATGTSGTLPARTRPPHRGAGRPPRARRPGGRSPAATARHRTARRCSPWWGTVRHLRQAQPARRQVKRWERRRDRPRRQPTQSRSPRGTGHPPPLQQVRDRWFCAPGPRPRPRQPRGRHSWRPLSLTRAAPPGLGGPGDAGRTDVRAQVRAVVAGGWPVSAAVAVADPAGAPSRRRRLAAGRDGAGDAGRGRAAARAARVRWPAGRHGGTAGAPSRATASAGCARGGGTRV